MESVAMWCVVKRATVRDKQAEAIGNLTFGQQCWKVDEARNGRIKILFIGENFNKKSGYVPARALSDKPVIDMARLYYQNTSGKRIPVSDRYRGEAVDLINVGDTVEVIAECNGWYLTNKGWTLSKWLTKCSGDYFSENAQSLCFAILLQACKEYKAAVDKIRMHKCSTPEDFAKAYIRITEIISWFKGKIYSVYFDDDGTEKLNWLNENVGIDDKWLKDKKRMFNELRAKGKIR